MSEIIKKTCSTCVDKDRGSSAGRCPGCGEGNYPNWRPKEQRKLGTATIRREGTYITTDVRTATDGSEALAIDICVNDNYMSLTPEETEAFYWSMKNFYDARQNKVDNNS